MAKNAYEDYYLTQARGGGFPVFVGNRQRGQGLGNLLGGIARMVVPVLKRGGKVLLKEGLRAGADILGDVIGGDGIKASAKKRIKQSGRRLLQNKQRKKPAAPPGQPLAKKRRVIKQTTRGRGKNTRGKLGEDIFTKGR